MAQHVDWRLRICALATALGIYLVISALLSTQSISFPAAHYELSGGRKSVSFHAVARGPPASSPLESSNDYGESPGRPDISVRPRNLAGVVEMSKKLTPRRIRSGRRIDWCQPVGFKAAAGPVVALASFPGSGNTWVRYLLQQATGILTGSVYKDYALLKNGFPAESIVNGSVLLVKTHEYGDHARAPFQRAVLLIRDPFSSLLAEFNRRSGGHIGFASADKYRRNGGRHWKNFVYNMANDWERMNLDWFYNFLPKRRLLVFYDELKENTEKELKRILDFLRVSISNSTLQCVLEKKEGIYKRGDKPFNFSPFDDAMKTMLEEKQRNVFSILKGDDAEKKTSSVKNIDTVESRGGSNININQPMPKASSTATSPSTEFSRPIESANLDLSLNQTAQNITS